MTVSGGPSAVLPVVVYLHGLVRVFGDVVTQDRLREPAGGAGTAADFPACMRSPEAHCPVAIEQPQRLSTVAEGGIRTGARGT
ncbi:hypothetical protein ACWC9U_19160 [Streptomyces sp. 900116325]